LLTSNNEEVSGWWLMYQQGADNIAIGKIEGAIKKVSALGNVLVALTDVGMRYWLWNEGKYKPYNFEDVKDLGVQFGLEGKGDSKYIGSVGTVPLSLISDEAELITEKQCVPYNHARIGECIFTSADFIPCVLENGKTYRIEVFSSVGEYKGKTLYPFEKYHYAEQAWHGGTQREEITFHYSCRVYVGYQPSTSRTPIAIGEDINKGGDSFSRLVFTFNGAIPEGQEQSFGIYMECADESEFTIHVEEVNAVTSEQRVIDPNDTTALNIITGGVNKVLSDAKEQGKFLQPFFARVAIELIDGTYICPSAPTLLVPSDGVEPMLKVLGPNTSVNIYASYIESVLKYRVLNNIDRLRGMSEIVKGIVIAITTPLSLYKQNVNENDIRNNFRLSEKSDYGDNWMSYLISGKVKRNEIGDGSPTDYTWRIKLPQNEISQLVSEIDNFYIVERIPLEDIVTDTWKDVKINNGVLSSLTTQPRLTGNVITLDKYIPEVMYVYNNRLTIGNVKLEKFEGYSPALMNGSTSADIWQGDVVEVKSRVLLNINGKSAWTNWKVDHFYYENVPHLWFYYPHSGAKKAEIYIDAYPEGTHYCMHWEVDLTEHPHLNGAYAFMNFNDIKSNFRYITKDEYDAVVVSDADPLLYPNELMQSRVDNPFVLDGELSSFIGHGEIRALTSATKPVSQGQAGVAPINVFTSDGVWSVGVSKEGKMETVQASDREVILEGVEPLQTDDVVIFATNNGLRLLNGNEVTDISAVLDGYDEVNGLKNMLSQISEFEDFYGSSVVQSNTQQSFVDILPGCKMLWDGANKLVRVFSEGGCYVMDMVSGEWSRSTEDMPLAVVAGFPYSIVQVEDKLMQYEKLKDNKELREGVAIVRETAFGSPMYMKMLNDIRTIKKWHGVNGCVLRIVVFVSNDRVTWYRLRSLNAQSWKWYRVAIYSKMTDVDAVEGVICRTEERRGKKLR